MQSFNLKEILVINLLWKIFKMESLVSKLKSDYIQFDSIKNKWTINKYQIREFLNNRAKISEGRRN